MKIVFLDFDDIKNPLLGAGQARATFNVGSELVKMGHQVYVITSRYPGCLDRTDNNGITYKHIGLGTNNIKINNAAYFFALPWHVLKIKADIIIECFTAPISTCFTPLFTKIPVVALPSMFNAKEFTRKYKLPFHLVEQLGIKLYKYMLPYSETDSSKAKLLNPEINFKIVGQGVGPEFLEIPVNEPKHILFFGRLDIWQKGIDLMLNSLSRISDKLDMPVLIAGHGPDKDEIEMLISNLNLQNKVKLIGPIYGEKKAKIFSETKFALFPSRHDEMCLATLELLAAGIPLVCFDIPESKWFSTEVSLKAKPYDLDEFAQLIIFASDKNLNAKMKLNARDFARKFKWENVASEFESFFEEILIKEAKV